MSKSYLPRSLVIHFLYALGKVAWLPQCINTFETLSLANGTSNRRSLKHLASLPTEAKLRCYGWECDTHLFFSLQRNCTLTSINIHPNANLWYSILDIQLASVHPFNMTWNLHNGGQVFWFFIRYPKILMMIFQCSPFGLLVKFTHLTNCKCYVGSSTLHALTYFNWFTTLPSFFWSLTLGSNGMGASLKYKCLNLSNIFSI
jgi:hypothetical protein